jgi:hypothetical protein
MESIQASFSQGVSFVRNNVLTAGNAKKAVIITAVALAALYASASTLLIVAGVGLGGVGLSMLYNRASKEHAWRTGSSMNSPGFLYDNELISIEEMNKRLKEGFKKWGEVGVVL